jgi:hypothetical protein
MTLNRTKISITAVSLVLSLAAACGDESGDEEGADTGSGTTPTTTVSTMSTTAMTMGDGSDSGSGDSAPMDVDYMADIQPIWDASCTAACHEPGGAYATFDLTAAASFAEMSTKPGYDSDMTFVLPGDSAGSFLVGALRGGTGVFVRRMPLMPGTNDMGMPVGLDGAAPLPEEQIALIEAWIDAGANP